MRKIAVDIENAVYYMYNSSSIHCEWAYIWYLAFIDACTRHIVERSSSVADNIGVDEV